MEVTRELVLPAPPAEVWEALTNPKRLEEWFANDVELEVAPGGEGRFRWESGEVRRAVVESIDDGRRLAMWWWDEEAAGVETLVTIALAEADEGTRIVVTESTSARAAGCAFEWALALELHFCLRSSEVLV